MTARFLSPSQLARRAFERAADDLFDAREAGKISPADAAAKLKRLNAAYLGRKENLRFADFQEVNGIDRIIRENARPRKALRLIPPNLNTVTEKVCAAIVASISPDRAA
jgi:hypothetical protein